jgi:hypothetical protein
MNGGPLRIEARREISVMGWSKGRASKEGGVARLYTEADMLKIAGS